MDLFTQAQQNSPRGLAEALRPADLAQLILPEKIRRQVNAWLSQLNSDGSGNSGHPPSLIFWGPPGSGKTSLARLLLKSTRGPAEERNGVDFHSREIKQLLAKARYDFQTHLKSTMLFLDEIHRLNRAEQDLLLPAIERGEVILLGATTENPSYELNTALLSRSRLWLFPRLQPENLNDLVRRALAPKNYNLEQVFTDEALSGLLLWADGDARRLLHALENLLSSLGEIKAPFTSEDLRELLDAPRTRYDADRDQHYDLASALIKSVRGSDPDAAVYYLARMLKGGEDPVFIARRLIILASEDVGNADPHALPLAMAALQAVEAVGMPEARINLAHVVTYLASAPKSNRAYEAIQKAYDEVDASGSLPIPMELRSARTPLMKTLGYGKGYLYSHESPEGFIAQRFLPSAIVDRRFYEPKEIGHEAEFFKRLKELWGNQKK